MQVVERAESWNHNVHYHPIVLSVVPEGATSALDVGCGEGFLARDLAVRIPRVVAIDRDAGSVKRAQAHPGSPGVEYLEGDFLSQELAPGSFDVVASVAALHQMDAEAALLKMRDAIAPGGGLVVVGLARSRRPWDFMMDACGVVVSAFHKLTKHYAEQTSPVVWPPPLSYRQVRVLGRRVLPGVRYRRHLMFRYSLVWTKPTEAGL